MTWDQCMYLGVQEGHNLIIQLHDDLYGGILQEFHRKDLPFDPHLGIGIFSKQVFNPKNPEKYDLDESSYKKALMEVEKVDIGYHCIIDKLTLIEVDEDFKDFTDLEDISL